MTTNVDLNEDMEDNVMRNEVIITVDGEDETVSMNDLNLTMDSTPNEILDAVKGIIEEMTGSTEGYVDAYNNYTYTVRKAMTSGTILVYPKPVAG